MSKDQALQFHANKAFERLNSAAQVYQRGENALGLMEDAAESVLILRSGIDALTAQRDEGLAREAEFRQTIEDQRAMIEAEQEMKATARKQRDKVTKCLANAQELLERWGNMFAGGIAASQLEELRNDNTSFLAIPGCADGEQQS